MSGTLPPGFAELERFAPTWCLATEEERFSQRMGSSMQDMIDFYDAFFPRLEEAIDYCDKFPIDDLPADVEHLVQLIHSLAMAAMAVEIFGQVKTVDAADAVLTRVREPLP